MYLARRRFKGKIHYILRMTCVEEGRLTFYDLLELGTNPSKYIVYPGGNSYYLNEMIESVLIKKGVNPDPDLLEDIFWPFIKPSVKVAIDYFRQRSTKGKKRGRLSALEKETIMKSVHPFDKRRAHYLKVGNMEQGPLERMPPVIFRNLVDKSRDEIEQSFMQQEQVLNGNELKTYVYTIFNLQQFFNSIISVKMPQAMDQDKVDKYFLEEICLINKALFKKFSDYSKNSVHEYLIRYLIMFFDNMYAGSTLLDEYAKDFKYWHHFFQYTQPEKRIGMKKAASVFGVEKEKLKNMDRKSLTRLYRRLAHEYHPDKGGDEEKFIELNRVYEGLMNRL